jgi:hypothetical protein
VRSADVSVMGRSSAGRFDYVNSSALVERTGEFCRAMKLDFFHSLIASQLAIDGDVDTRT